MLAAAAGVLVEEDIAVFFGGVRGLVWVCYCLDRYGVYLV